MCCKSKLGGVFTYHVYEHSDPRLNERHIQKVKRRMKVIGINAMLSPTNHTKNQVHLDYLEYLHLSK